MRIGFFAESYYPFASGVANSIDSFASYLVSRGHEVHLYCPKTDKPSDYLGMRVYSLPSVPSILYPGLSLALPLAARIPPLDIVHAHGVLGSGILGRTIALRRNIPLVCTVHTLPEVALMYFEDMSVKTRALHSLVWKWFSWFYSRCNAIITPSRVVRDRVQKMTGYKRDIRIISTGVDTRGLKPIPQKRARQRLGLSTGEKILLHLGRVAKEKRIDVIISALGMLDDWRLLVAGTGPWLDRLREHARRVGVADRVDFLGFVPEEEKNLYYSSADAFVIASRFDTQGIVLLEAMACGCPVVASRAMALPEFVSHGENGLLFRYGSPRDLARVVREHENDLEKMRKRARKTAENYSIEKMGKLLLGLYEELLGKG